MHVLPILFFVVASLTAVAQDTIPATGSAVADDVAVVEQVSIAVESPGSDAPRLDSGDTAWILTSTALVLFMTIPALALFYGGLVRTKNVLSVLMQCLVLTAILSVVWVVFGYSLAFDTTDMEAGKVGLSAFFGGVSLAFLQGVTPDSLTGTIPTVLHAAFQMTFAVITPALMIGAFAERMKFSAVLVFSTVWLVVVYLPICHMTWAGDGALFGTGESWILLVALWSM